MLTGHCLCGSVQYEIDGDVLALMYCHCEECRRATGSSLNTSIFVRRSDCRIVCGDAALYADPDGIRIEIAHIPEDNP